MLQAVTQRCKSLCNPSVIQWWHWRLRLKLNIVFIEGVNMHLLWESGIRMNLCFKRIKGGKYLFSQSCEWVFILKLTNGRMLNLSNEWWKNVGYCLISWRLWRSLTLLGPQTLCWTHYGPNWTDKSGQMLQNCPNNNKFVYEQPAQIRIKIRWILFGFYNRNILHVTATKLSKWREYLNNERKLSFLQVNLFYSTIQTNPPTC